MATFPAGIAYAISALDTWLYDGDPMDALAFEEEIAYLRSMLDGDFYEKILEKYILNSTHSATLYMIPSATIGEEKERAERERLAKIKADMNGDEIEEIVELTERMEKWQQTPDTEEALATIPKIAVSDINELPEKLEFSESVIDGVTAAFAKSDSRGIIYTSLTFDISDFNEDELFGVSILADLYKNVGTESMSAVELQNKIKTELGVFNTSTIVATKDKVVTPYFQVSVSVLKSKLDSVADITREVLLCSVFDDKDSIGKIIRQLKLGSQEGMSASGHSLGFGRAAAYTILEAAVKEHLGGLENYLKLRALDTDYEKYADELSVFMKALAKKIFTKKRLSVQYSGEWCEGYFENIVSLFPEGEDFERGTKIMPLGIRNEGILIPAFVSFAAMAGYVLKYYDNMHGSISVARSILSYEYLWNSIRVQGGAYGAGFIERANGAVGFYTYRDPSAQRSVGIFKKTSEFLRKFAEENDNIDGFIIGAIGDSEPLITPKVLNALVLVARLSGDTYEKKVQRRREMLNTSKEDLTRLADALDGITSEAGVTIVGGKAQLDAAEDIIDIIIEI